VAAYVPHPNGLQPLKQFVVTFLKDTSIKNPSGWAQVVWAETEKPGIMLCHSAQSVLHMPTCTNVQIAALL